MTWMEKISPFQKSTYTNNLLLTEMQLINYFSTLSVESYSTAFNVEIWLGVLHIAGGTADLLSKHNIVFYFSSSLLFLRERGRISLNTKETSVKHGEM